MRGTRHRQNWKPKHCGSKTAYELYWTDMPLAERRDHDRSTGGRKRSNSREGCLGALDVLTMTAALASTSTVG